MPITLTPIASGSGSTWVTTAEADTYFATRHGIGTLWSQYDSAPASKTALLVTAQMVLETSPDFTFPDEVTAAMQNAVCEQAFFMLLDPDMQTRLALIAQGVEEAGLVMEKYRQGANGDMPIAGLARRHLASIQNDDNHEIRLVR